MTETKQNLGEIVTWCQNWLITTNRATNAKEFEILGRAIMGCFKIYIYNGICNGYCSGKRMSNADWQADKLIDEAIREWKTMVGEK